MLMESFDRDGVYKACGNLVLAETIDNSSAASRLRVHCDQDTELLLSCELAGGWLVGYVANKAPFSQSAAIASSRG